MHETTRIILIGLRGSGKTTIGRALAVMMGESFADTDAVVCLRAQMSIAEIFQQEGERGFRDREKAAVEEALASADRVIALGGGALTTPTNVEAIRGAGLIVWLRAPAEILASRVQADPLSVVDRPSLTGEGALEEMILLEKERSGLFAELANFEVDVSARSPAPIAAALAVQVREWNSQRGRS